MSLSWLSQRIKSEFGLAFAPKFYIGRNIVLCWCV